MDKKYSNTLCAKKALNELGLDFADIGNHPDAIFVPELNECFISCTTPFNTQSVSRLLKDKYFTYKLLKDLARQPKTISFFDFTRKKWKEFIKEKSFDEMLLTAKKELDFPMIVKRNGGERGNHVFLVENDEEFKKILAKIFRNNKHYDYLALAQEYIKPKRELRLVYVFGELALVYEKSIKGAKFVGNLSPLHWEGAKAIMIIDEGLKQNLSEIFSPIFKKIKINWCGMDVIEDENGQFWLLEINGAPAFDYFVRDNGVGEVVRIFKEAINKYRK